MRSGGVQNVFGHSNSNSSYFNIDGQPLTAGEFYNKMIENGYKPGTKINLYSCGSGSNGLAQEISNLSGAEVVAPTGDINPTRGGNLDKGTTGIKGSEVKIFKPIEE